MDHAFKDCKRCVDKLGENSIKVKLVVRGDHETAVRVEDENSFGVVLVLGLDFDL